MLTCKKYILVTQVSNVASGFFMLWVTREAQEYWSESPIPSPGGTSQPRNWTGVSCIAGGFFTREAPNSLCSKRVNIGLAKNVTQFSVEIKDTFSFSPRTLMNSVFINQMTFSANPINCSISIQRMLRTVCVPLREKSSAYFVEFEESQK